MSTIKRSDEDDFGEVEELPSSASEVPLSRTGSVYLLAATAASSVLFDAPASSPRLSLIPDFAAILGGCLGDAATGSTGAEPEPLIDAVLFLGFLTVNARQTISTDSDETFNNILQRLSLLSANIPSPVLRYHAHRLTCTTLHLHTSDHVRLAFIRNTLEHCPFENLKVSAVGWLKDEILAADNVVPDHKELDAEPSIFAKPAALTTLLPFLFPEPSDIMDGQTVPGRFATFQAQQPFHLAVLNLVYLLLSSTTLTARLQMAALTKETLFSKFLEHLLDASRNFQHSISGGELGFGDGEANDAGLAAMKLMEMSVEQVTGACRRLRFWPLPPDGDNGQI